MMKISVIPVIQDRGYSKTICARVIYLFPLRSSVNTSGGLRDGAAKFTFFKGKFVVD